MAIIKCAECKKDVSDQAVACPHCGAPLKVKAKKSKFLIVLLSVIVLFIGFLVLGASESAKHQAATSTEGLTERSTFYMEIIDKSSDEVKQKVGIPDSTQSYGSNDNWYYNRKTYDYKTGKPDYTAQVVFEYDRVKTVNFN